MKLIFLSNYCHRTGTADVCVPRLVGVLGVGLVALISASLWVGYEFGMRAGVAGQSDQATTEVIEMLDNERRQIAEAKAEQRAHLDALAMKIAELQSHVIRLDALGGRLVDIGKLDADEFDFASSPPQGGIDEVVSDQHLSPAELGHDMQRIGQMLRDREDKLVVLEKLLMERRLITEVTPSGRPVKKGWISSGYGKRTDPFNGRKSFHRGVDFAGKPGSEVIAVASGVVVRAEKNSGFGNLVEIRHAGGFSTLYAHNKENRVQTGDVVAKGQTIALLGSTGRSSGPHVHFEVHRDGKNVNPLRYVR